MAVSSSSPRTRVDLHVRAEDQEVWAAARALAKRRRQSLSAYVASALERYQILVSDKTIQLRKVRK